MPVFSLNGFRCKQKQICLYGGEGGQLLSNVERTKSILDPLGGVLEQGPCKSLDEKIFSTQFFLKTKKGKFSPVRSPYKSRTLVH